MGGVGLSGRSFIPLLSSFACAIPGIMAARTIANPRDRLVTIMIAPLMTCSARLPVYALLIGAFVPQRDGGGGGFNCRGWCCSGCTWPASSAPCWSWPGCSSTCRTAGRQVRTLMMELPHYHWPGAQHRIGLWQRVKIFLRRVGGIILVLTVALWLLSSFPGHRPGATGAADRVQPGRHRWAGRWPSCSRRSASTGRSASRWCRAGRARGGGERAGTVYALSATGDDAARRWRR
jgi:ferrous iron transport protein B